jgi:molybdenum cofactor cytidylyltransferase
LLLKVALRIEPGQAIAFVGAGGKSTAIRRLAEEPGRALITTTTRLGHGQAELGRRHWIDPTLQRLKDLPSELEAARTVLVTGPLLEGEQKWSAPGRELIEALHRIARETGAALLIEADGARGRSLKAPADHEPVVPDFTNQVVAMAGLDVLDQPIESAAVHRPERVAAVLGRAVREPLRPQDLARLLASPEAGLKGIPAAAEVRVLLNKLDPAGLDPGREIAAGLIQTPRIRAAVLADLRSEDPVREVHGRVAGVVLAAGGSSRLGEPKQLVEFRGRPLVWHVVRLGLAAGLSPLVVVVGAAADPVRQALAGEPIQFLDNPDWASGQSTSVRAGLAAVGAEVEAAIFLLSDMPLIGPQLVRAVVQAHRTSLAPLVAPRAGGRRANPALFDRVTFPALRQLTGDQGGRSLFDRFPSVWVEWAEAAMLDLDTPEDLRRLRDLE